jgi:erythrin-vacuolar iron transport family protein
MPSESSTTRGSSATTRPTATLGAPINLASLSLQDALDLAILMEDEARERYEEFTRIVGGRYKGDAADMFRMMAGNEAKHGQQLADRRRSMFGEAPRRLTRDMLDDVEAPDRGKPRVFMSARQAMEVALASEEKAHDFFASALTHVSDPSVKTLFEELRAEELQHHKLVKERLEKLPKGPDLEDDEADDPGSDPGN